MSTQCGKGRSLVAVDNLLDSIGLYRKNVAYDETCLFRAVSEQLFDCQIHHERVRRECIEYARNNYHEFQQFVDNESEWLDHLDLLEKHMVICGDIEIQIISRKYNRDVMIYDANQKILLNVTKRNLESTLMLCLTNEDHYDVIYKREHIQNAGFCQSIIYGILYEDVFKIADVPRIVHGMLYDKGFITLSSSSSTTPEINNNNCDNIEDSQLQQVNIAPFPFKVAKALDPTIYRNIEFDSWAEVRKQMRLGDWYYGDNNLILGTRCLFNNNNETYECYIQEMIKEQNKCVVYLTKFGERRLVNYTDLSPEGDAKPWPLPYRFSKNLVLTTNKNQQQQQIDKSPKNSKKHKEKRTNKTTNYTIKNPGKNNETDINAYVGAPLQIQSSLETTNSLETSNEQTDQSQHNLLVTPQVTSPIQEFTWESPMTTTTITTTSTTSTTTWNNTTESVIWPQLPTNQTAKPIVTSLPTTPIILPYYDNPFVYNYGVDNYTWQSQSDYIQDTIDNTNNEQEQSSNNNNNNDETYQLYNETYEQVQIVNERPTLCTAIPLTEQQQQQVEVYSPIIQLPPGTPVIYTHTPELNEMFVPTPTHVPIYTPPIQYVQPSAYVYPNTPPTWYTPGRVHPQHGFVFPTPYNQNITQ